MVDDKVKKRGKQVKEGLDNSEKIPKKKPGKRKDPFADKSIAKLTKRYTDKAHKKIQKEKSILPKQKEPDTLQFFSTKKHEKSKISLEAPEKDNLINQINEKLISLLKILFAIIIFVVIIVLFYYVLTNDSKNLQAGENIEKAYVKAGILHVSLEPDDLAGVNGIRFIFLGEKEYYLTNRKDLKLNYEFSALDLGIESLDEIEKVSAVLEYSR
jgi:hypothetical protein